MKNIQSEDLNVADFREPNDIHKFLWESGRKLTKMVNMSLGIYDETKGFQRLEISWLNIKDAETNPFGLKGFWDVSYKTDDELNRKRWSIEEITPELVK